MAKASEHLEHMQHAAHAGEHGHGDDHSNPLSMYAGITMAVLGVILAFAAAKVGGERTILVKDMVEQQDAHMRYITQDLKHRIAVISLRQMRATLPTLSATGKVADGKEIAALARTVQRYYAESKTAGKWADAYSPGIEAHVEAQEYYEWGMLSAEIGIVMASVSLLLRKRMVWYLSMMLGVASLGMLAFTYMHTAPVVHRIEEVTKEAGKEYREARASNKTTEADDALAKEVIAQYGDPGEK